MNTEMKMEKRMLSELRPAEYNPRKALTPEDKEYQDIKRSIEKFGYVDPIIINSDGTVIRGRQRLTVLTDMGYETADVVVVNLDKDDEKALGIALNKITGERDDIRQMSDNREVKGGLYRTEAIAHLFGISVRRIQQLTQEGIIKTTKVLEDGRTVRRYDLVPTIQSYVKHLSEKAYGKAGRSEKEMELREKKMEADAALKESQSELHRLKTAIAAGQYISIEEVKMDYAKFFVVFKKFAMALPSRTIGMIAGALEPAEARRVEKEIAQEINRLLGAFVIAGIVGPDDVEEEKKSGTKKKKVPDKKV